MITMLMLLLHYYTFSLKFLPIGDRSTMKSQILVITIPTVTILVVAITIVIVIVISTCVYLSTKKKKMQILNPPNYEMPSESDKNKDEIGDKSDYLMNEGSNIYESMT